MFSLPNRNTSGYAACTTFETLKVGGSLWKMSGQILVGVVIHHRERQATEARDIDGFLAFHLAEDAELVFVTCVERAKATSRKLTFCALTCASCPQTGEELDAMCCRGVLSK